MEYEASLDNLTKTITAFLYVVVGILLIVLVKMITTYGLSNLSIAAPVLPLVILALVIFFSYLFHTTGYAITGGNFVIIRPAGKVKIALAEIASARQVAKGEMKFTIRTFGVGGLYGYFGSFYNKTFGSMTWYVTRRDKMVIIETKENQKIVISPDNLELITILNASKSK